MSATLAFALAAALQSAEPPPAPPRRLPNVVVVEQAPPSPNAASVPSAQLRDGAPADLGEVLRGINGVNASRMGGHGLDPQIRGQSQGQLNIRLDGMELHGACPNRMDPPTAFAQPSTLDRVTVEKGVQTLRNGPGGSGGAVLIERRLPWDSRSPQGRVGVSGIDNGDVWQVAADVAGAADRMAWRVSGSAEDRSDYRDGDGAAVRSGLRRDTVQALFGWRPADGHEVELGLDHSDTRDARYAGAGMDAPVDRLSAWRLGYRADIGEARLDAKLWSAEVDHVMDNVSLRPHAPGAMAMRVPASADTRGAELAIGLPDLAGWTLDAGLQWSQLDRLAIRSAGPSPTQIGMVNALLWPDVRLARAGAFVEGERALDAATQLRLGLRVDRFRADAALAGQRVSATTPAPAQFYAQYGDASDLSPRHTGVGALARIDHQWSERVGVFAGASRSVRAADSTELFIAAMSATPSGRWIGNPGLAPERHSQLDAGLTWTDAARRASVVVFTDRVDDYILRDRARGQTGVGANDGATVYRNIDARLSGIELEFGWSPDGPLGLDAQLAYVRGSNRDDDRPLAQIAPLSARLALSLDTRLGRWTATARGAARQHRADTSTATGSGLDARQTPGWAVLDLAWSRRFGAHQLRVGVNNAGDRLYAEHLNRANADPFNPDAVQVNEPGRSVTADWTWTF